MAGLLNMELEFEEITDCPVCFIPFRDPQKLICDHSLCKKCVDFIKKGHQISCPKCNVMSNINDVKSDFRLAQFLEAFAKQAQVLTQVHQNLDLEGLILCEFCGKRPISHNCVDCKQSICSECKIIHSRINALKSHRLISLEQHVKTGLEEECRQLLDKKRAFENSIQTFEDAVNQARAIEIETLDVSKDIREKCISEVHDLFDSYAAVIHDNIDQNVYKYDQEKMTLGSKIDKIISKIAEAESLTKGDIPTLVSRGEALISDIKIFTEALGEPATSVDLPSIGISRNKDWDPSNAASIFFEQSRKHGSCPQKKPDERETKLVKTGAFDDFIQTGVSTPSRKTQQTDGSIPLTPGRRTYDRHFLLSLRYAPDSVIKPDGLPNFPEIILDTILEKTLSLNLQEDVEFSPGYVLLRQKKNLQQNNQYTLPRAPVPPTRQPRPAMQMQQSQGSQNYPYSGRPMGQPLTTMFLPPQAVSMQGARRLITMPGTGGQIPVNQMQHPHQYTIKTSQPTQFQVTPNAYYQPQPMQAMQISGTVQTPTSQSEMQQTGVDTKQSLVSVTTASQPESYQKKN